MVGRGSPFQRLEFPVNSRWDERLGAAKSARRSLGSVLDHSYGGDRSFLLVRRRQQHTVIEYGLHGHTLAANPEAATRSCELRPAVRRSQISSQPFRVQLLRVCVEAWELVRNVVPVEIVVNDGVRAFEREEAAIDELPRSDPQERL